MIKDYEVSIQEFFEIPTGIKEAPIRKYSVTAEDKVDAMFKGLELFQDTFKEEQGEKYLVSAKEIYGRNKHKEI